MLGASICSDHLEFQLGVSSASETIRAAAIAVHSVPKVGKSEDVVLMQRPESCCPPKPGRMRYDVQVRHACQTRIPGVMIKIFGLALVVDQTPESSALALSWYL